MASHCCIVVGLLTAVASHCCIVVGLLTAVASHCCIVVGLTHSDRVRVKTLLQKNESLYVQFVCGCAHKLL